MAGDVIEMAAHGLIQPFQPDRVEQLGYLTTSLLVPDRVDDPALDPFAPGTGDEIVDGGPLAADVLVDPAPGHVQLGNFAQLAPYRPDIVGEELVC
jgi:hypothetical protein